MSLSRVFAVFVRQLFLFKSNPTRLVSIFLWLIVDVILWGFISRYLASMGQATFNFVTVILGAIILWEFMSRIQQGIMMAFLEDIWSQNFINYFASPLKIREYLSGLIITSICSGIAGFIVMILIAAVLFGYNALTTGALLLPFMVVLLLFGIAMGIFVSAVIFRLGPSAEWLGWPIPMVLSLFVGVFYPVSTLPATLRLFSAVMPPSYVFETMRSVLTTGLPASSIASNLLIGGVLAVIYLVLTSRFFIRIYHKNLASGTIARFNAEAL
ncbi:MAG TPA: ABC transporter permease [Syntrophorhabdales bacterium]|nr:ABC transporter permease [Syntrophorhabdales bacterium]